MPRPTRVTVRVPGSSANLGAGFDALGLALGVYVEVTAELIGDGLSIEPRGREADQIDRGPANLVYQRIVDVHRARTLPVPGLRLQIDNQIPLLRGLGASGAAAIAGLMIGNQLCGKNLSADEILRMACAAEGHPDNVTPSLLGGFVTMAMDGSTVRYARVVVPPEVACVVLVPRFGMKTSQARQILPAQVSMADAVFNLSRSALTVAAFTTRQWGLLGVGTQDRLHQPYRTSIFPAMPGILEAARAAGAHGACLSGAGSTLLAICPPARATEVANAMLAEATAREVAAETMQVPVDNQGATLLS